MNKGIKMVSIAGYLPDNVVTNDDLSKIMETSDEWIQSHTGIKQGTMLLMKIRQI